MLVVLAWQTKEGQRVSKLTATPLIPLPGQQWSRATPAQTLPVDQLDRHGLQTDIVEQPRMLTAFAKLMAGLCEASTSA